MFSVLLTDGSDNANGRVHKLHPKFTEVGSDRSMVIHVSFTKDNISNGNDFIQKRNRSKIKANSNVE